jgi:hypothetical protein
LSEGRVKSCGCFQAENRLTACRTHGYSGTPEYAAWAKARERCYNVKDRGYKTYGARGIVMCDKWRSDFAAFIADMGPKPGPEYSLDRINNDGPYSPDNCRWASRHQQMRNTTKTVWLTDSSGHTMIQADWARHLGVNPMSLVYRRKMGWPEHEIISKPPRRPSQKQQLSKR